MTKIYCFYFLFLCHVFNIKNVCDPLGISCSKLSVKMNNLTEIFCFNQFWLILDGTTLQISIKYYTTSNCTRWDCEITILSVSLIEMSRLKDFNRRVDTLVVFRSKSPTNWRIPLNFRDNLQSCFENNSQRIPQQNFNAIQKSNKMSW